MDLLRGSVWSISNGLVELEAQSLGAMIGPVKVAIGDKIVSPFAVAPWAGEQDSATLPPILQRLRGEWPCVPFGITIPSPSFPAHWYPDKPELDTVVNCAHPHGYGSNHYWRVDKHEADAIELCIDYPEHSPISRLRRHITLPAGQTRIEFSLTVEARNACRLPIGLHPTFALSAATGGTELRPGAYRFGRTYPVRFEASSMLAIDQQFRDLGSVPLEDGRTADLGHLPFADMREEIVQLYAIDGHFTLINHEGGYASTLNWNPGDFPSCILWISNRGRDAYPWSSRHVALGIEPTCSFFDLNPSAGANPLSPLIAQGIRTLKEFAANESWVSAYSIEFAGIH